MDAVQTKQIMRQSLFIWTSVTQKHKMPLGTAWNGLFAVFVWSFYPKPWTKRNRNQRVTHLDTNETSDQWNTTNFTKTLPLIFF